MDQAYQRRTVSYYYGTTRAFNIDIWQFNSMERYSNPLNATVLKTLFKYPFILYTLSIHKKANLSPLLLHLMSFSDYNRKKSTYVHSCLTIVEFSLVVKASSRT